MTSRAISIHISRQHAALSIDIIIKIFLLIFAVIVLVPLVFMFTASFMPSSEIIQMPYQWIPSKIAWKNFYRALAGNDGNFLYIRNILNSLFVSVTVAFTTVILSSITGYSLAKFKFKGKNVVFMGIMMTMMIPFETIMVPIYLVALKLGMQNSYQGLIIPFMMNAFGVFLMRQYLQTFPSDIIDAARIDGCSEPRIFRSIVLVNSGPAVASLAILTFRQQWDNLMWPLMIAQDKKYKTIPTYIVSFAEEKLSDEGAMMAAALIASIPVIIMFLSLSKYFVGGSSVYSSGKE